MIRTGLLVAILAAGPVAALPPTLVLLQQPTNSAPALLDRVTTEAPEVSGMPLTWDMLLKNDRTAPSRDICRVIGDADRSSGEEPSVDPALILKQLRMRGLCESDAG